MAAIEWKAVCNSAGKVVNRYRIVESESQPYIELILRTPKGQAKQVTWFDVEDLDNVKLLAWRCDNGYAGAKVPTPLQKRYNDRKYVRMHRLFQPDVEVVDHINRIRHDNRRANLRNGQGLNHLNTSMRSTNSSGCTGVRKEKDRDVFIVDWIEDTRHFSKSFSFAENNKQNWSQEEAFEAAKQFRQERDRATGNRNGWNTEFAIEAGVSDPEAPKFVPSETIRALPRGICNEQKLNRYVVAVQVNKKRVRRYFTYDSAKIGMTKQQAKKKALECLARMRVQKQETATPETLPKGMSYVPNRRCFVVREWKNNVETQIPFCHGPKSQYTKAEAEAAARKHLQMYRESQAKTKKKKPTAAIAAESSDEDKDDPDSIETTA
jgi:hypothetical protein